MAPYSPGTRILADGNFSESRCKLTRWRRFARPYSFVTRMDLSERGPRPSAVPAGAEATQLLLAVYDSEIDFGISDEPELIASPSLKKPASPEQKKITSSDKRDKCVIQRLAAADNSTT